MGIKINWEKIIGIIFIILLSFFIMCGCMEKIEIPEGGKMIGIKVDDEREECWLRIRYYDSTINDFVYEWEEMEWHPCLMEHATTHSKIKCP